MVYFISKMCNIISYYLTLFFLTVIFQYGNNSEQFGSGKGKNL